MGQRTQQAKQQAALGYAVGLDDISSSLDFKKRWNDYSAAVTEAQNRAKSKSGILSFIRTAVFFVASVFAPGSWGIAAKAGLAFGSSAAAGMAADDMVGGIKKPKAPEMKATRFKKSRNIERQTELEGAYEQLGQQIDDMESDMDTAHWMQPLTLATTFYGPQMIEQIAAGGAAAGAGASPTVGVDGTAALSPEGVPVGASASTGVNWGNIIGQGSKIGVGVTGASQALNTYMSGLSTDYVPISERTSGYDYSTVQDIDYDDVAATLDIISEDAFSRQGGYLPEMDTHASLDSPPWESSTDYLDYLDEVTDDLTVG